MRQALLYVSNNYREFAGRVIILTDSESRKIDALKNKWDSDAYNIPIADCQGLLKSFHGQNVPEIYWIKGHSGIPGNEKVDRIANSARMKAQQLQPDLLSRQHRSACFLNKHGLNPYFTKKWNRHWICEGSEIQKHNIPRMFLPNLIETHSFEKIVLHSLTFSD